MFDDLEAQFLENVLPAYNAFSTSLKSNTAGQNSDLRLGKDAALALFHLREHVPWAQGQQWPPFLTGCPEYVLLQDIVNVFKHGPRREGQVAKPTDVYELIVLTEYEDLVGPFQKVTKEITVELRDGSVRDLKALLKRVLGMWISEFKARGLLTRLEPPSPEPEIMPTRDADHGGGRLNLEILQGLRFNSSFCRRKFNYATGQVEPVDITGHTYEFSVDRLVEAGFILTNSRTGQRIEGTVHLSPEESAHYRSLQSDEGRKAFEASLAPKYASMILAQEHRRALTNGDTGEGLSRTMPICSLFPEPYEATNQMSDHTPVRAAVDIQALPVMFPTHLHEPAFWESLGRAVATFGFLEEVLGKAIFALTATRRYDETEIEEAFAEWVPKLEQALIDPLGNLIDAYGKAMRAHQDASVDDLDDLLLKLRAAAEVRNVLCHGSWAVPRPDGASIPLFVNRQKRVFDTPIDRAFLNQVQRHVAELSGVVVSTVTRMGWRFPGAGGPGQAIWS